MVKTKLDTQFHDVQHGEHLTLFRFEEKESEYNDKEHRYDDIDVISYEGVYISFNENFRRFQNFFLHLWGRSMGERQWTTPPRSGKIYCLTPPRTQKG